MVVLNLTVDRSVTVHTVHAYCCSITVHCCYIATFLWFRMSKWATVEPLYSRQVGAGDFVRYSEVPFIGRFRHNYVFNPLYRKIMFK